jgi:hypothetical protein
MFNYFQGIMLTALEMICCKMFFEIFGEKRSEHNWKNYGLILGLILSMYSFALLFYEKFVLKQVMVIFVIVLFMIWYLKINIWKAVILSLLFQGLLLSIDYGTLWLNVSLFHSIAEINERYYVAGRLIAVLAKILLFLVVLMIKKRLVGSLRMF